MKNKMLFARLLLLGMIMLSVAFGGFAQKTNKSTSNKSTGKKTTSNKTSTNKSSTSKTDPKKTQENQANSENLPVADYQKQAEELIRFMEGTLNALGSENTPVREKQIMINESYNRIFLDDKVQIEDDLDENREIFTYKGVQAYMQDVDFFFKEVNFSFKIQGVETLKNADGNLVLKFKALRHLKGIGLDGDSVNSLIDRYIEINYNENDQSLKIVSMYTTKLNEDEENMKWWNGLNETWKKILQDKNAVSDPVDLNKVKNILRTSELDISNNQTIKNLEPLTKLSRLKRLDCNNTGITDLYPIRSLNKLEVVNCSGTGITSIEPLQYASGLTDLFIDNTKISNIATVENFPNLKRLSFENTEVSDIENLIECSGLEDLRMSGTKVNSLNVLAELTELKVLRINSLSVNSLEGIKNHKKLEQLSFSTTRISDINLLSGFENLQIVYFNNIKEIASLDALKGLKKLEYVYCDNTGIDAEKASAFMSSMPSCLVVYNSDVLKQWWEDMSPEWKSLFDNDLKTNKPGSEQLHKLSLIKELNLSVKPVINTLEPVAKFTHLTSIDLSGTAIEDLSPLKNLVDLERINCSGTKITKVDDLSGLSRLEYVDISKTGIKDISVLSNCDNLEMIYADNTGISKISSLSKLKRLKRIFADNTQLTKDEVFAFNEVQTLCLVVFRTEELKKWWNMVEDDWKKVFRQYVEFGDKISGEQLHQVTVLREIDVKTNTEIRNLKPLDMISYLEVLRFSDTRINDLIAIKDLKNLRELVCPRNPIEMLDAISGLNKLEILDCSNTLIKELEPLEGIKTLTVLKVSGTKVSSLKPLEGMTLLSHLDISGTKTVFLKPIMELKKLRLLKCYNTRIPGFMVKNFKEANPDCEVMN